MNIMIDIVNMLSEQMHEMIFDQGFAVGLML